MQGPRVRPEYRGGLEDAGIQALRAFVDAGGTLVTFGNAAELAIDRLDAPLTIATRGDDLDGTYCPGALLRIRLTPDHPVTFGMPEEADAMFVMNSGYAASRGADGDHADRAIRRPTDFAAAAISPVATVSLARWRQRKCRWDAAASSSSDSGRSIAVRRGERSS